MFEGTYVALVTPFSNNKLDLDALERHITFLLDNGVDGLVACGTTGESPTLTQSEWEAVVSTAVKAGRGRPVLAGTGSNSTDSTVARTCRAKDLGAAGALVVVPYYNKPTQEGLYQHFAKVADVGIPVILYNIPGRSSRNMDVTTTVRLSGHGNIVGIKEASGSLDAAGALVVGCGSDFSVLSGEDSLSLPMYALGGRGVIATTGNVAPRLMSDVYRFWERGENAEALKCHQRLMPLFSSMFVETNPAPVKYALSLMGFVRNELRLPLVPVSEASEKIISKSLKDVGIL